MTTELPVPPPDASLQQLLSHRARRATPGRLGLDVVAGALVAATVLWARPPGWGILVSAASCVFAYGVWAVAERHLHPEAWPFQVRGELAWLIVRALSGVLGLAAFVALLLTMLGIVLGPLVS